MARDYYDESKPKKKKKETPKPQKVTKSPSVTKAINRTSNSTFLGGGADVKKAEKRTSAPTRVTKPSERVQRTPTRTTTPQRATDTGTRNQTSRTSRLTAAQTQKTYGTTRPNLKTAEEMRKEREAQRKESEAKRKQMQLKKSGLAPEDQPTAAQKAATDRALKNTLPIAKESAKGAAYGHLTTLNDIASIKSQGNGKSREEIYDPNLAEKSRQQAEQRVKKYQAKTQETEDAIQKLTKNAKGLEKAYYGAVESGTGMLTDIGVGAITGTGQIGSLASMFSRTYGSTRGKAQQEGATEAEDRAYAAAQAAKEVGTELMFPGAGLARGYAGKQGLKLADTAANILTKNLRGKAADIGGAGVRLLGGVLEENAEEVAGWGLDPLIKEITYGKNVRTRNAQQAMKERSNALRAEIQNEDDARAAAAYLSSDDFFEQTVNAYREAGLSKKDAEEVADRMRDYLTASLTGDTDSMEQIEDEVSKKVAGSKKLEWDFDELKDTIASTTLLTAATGLPGTGMTAVKGAALRDQLGDDGVRALASTAIDFEDSEMSLKAKAMKARLDSGNELTSTQVYDLQVGMQEQIRKDTQREESSRRMADKRIKSDNLLTPYRQNENGGIDLDEATEASYREHVSRANEIIDGLTSETKESLTANEKVDGSKAIAGFQTGVFTIEDANTLNYSNTTVRAAFEEATGVDLGQYVVKNKDGSVNIPATNTKTKDALFAMAADNLVKSAQAETANWMDNAKGQVVTQVSARMGASGSAVLQQALDDVDERDRSKYMMTANAADMLYQAARNMGTEWESIAPEATRMFPGISESKLKMMYEAGLADREMANDKARGRQVRMGQALTEMGEQETATGKVFIDTEVPVKGSVIRTFTEIAKNLGADIHFVDYIYDSENNPIAGANGSYDPNTNTFYLNVATGAETNIGYIFMHETTHYLKTYAPEQYQALENLVREKWFAFNPSQMQDAIARKIEAYKRATKGQQVLTEEQALEEIIADASHDFLNDPEFARQVAEEDMGLAKAVLDSIRNALRMLRRIFASGSIDDDTHMNSLFRELDIMAEAEKLWLDAYKVAVQNSAINAVDTWQDDVNAQSSLSVSDDYTIQDGNARWTDDRIDYIIRDNGERFTNKTHAWAAMINPRDFLKLTLDDRYLDLWNEAAQNVPEEVKGMSYAEADEYVYQKFRETGEWIHDNENYPLDEEELRGERTTPFLKILQVGNSVNVDGHEGRHRMRALMEAGIKSVPVLITTNGRNEKSNIDSLTLRSQEYGFPGPVNNGATVKVSDLVPVTENNRDELIQKFGGEAQVRFSMSEPVERVKDLIAVHNLNEEDLVGNLGLGGFPMPSIAITKDSMGHEKYGDISLLFHSDTIDPTVTNANQVFGGDAYTPTFPTVHYKANSKVSKKLVDMYYNNSNTLGYDAMRPMYEYAVTIDDTLDRVGGEAKLIDKAKKDTALMRLYLRMNDKDVETITTSTTTSLSDAEVERNDFWINELGKDAILEARPSDLKGREAMQHFANWRDERFDELKKAYEKLCREVYGFDDAEIKEVMADEKTVKKEISSNIVAASLYLKNGRDTTKTEIDYAATNKLVEETAKANGYDAWVDDLFKGIEEKSGIRNDKDWYTPAGNRRSWESLHEPVTLDNVVRQMKKELDSGGGTFLGNNPVGAAQKKYKSLDEIRADEDRLQYLDDENYGKLREQATAKLSKVAHEIYENSPKRMNSYAMFGAIDVGSDVAEVLNKTRNKDKLKKILERDYSYNVSEQNMDDLMDALHDLANLPTGYFEAKPKRAVRFDEVKAAIVPEGFADHLKAQLSTYGTSIYEYNPEIEGDRTEKVNQAASENNLRFSISETDSDGNILTDGQMEYFKDSQARNSEGKMQVVYHTTNMGGFTVFDPKYSDDKRSLFFASNFDVSQTYGTKKARKPIDLNPQLEREAVEYKDLTENDLMKMVNNHGDFRVWTQEEYDSYVPVGQESYHGYFYNPSIMEEFEKEYPDGNFAGGYRFYAYLKDLKEGKVKDDEYVLTYYDNPGHVYVKGKTMEELLKNLSQREYDKAVRAAEEEFRQRQIDARAGYYSCYLNLENPLVVDANGGYWHSIEYRRDEPTQDDIITIAENESVRKVSYLASEFGDYNDDGVAQKLTLVVRGSEKNEDGEWIPYEYNESWTVNLDDLDDPYDASSVLSENFYNYLWKDLQFPDFYIDDIINEADKQGDIEYVPTSVNPHGLEDFITETGGAIYNKWGWQDYMEDNGYDFVYAPTYSTRELASLAEDEGYDGVIIRNVYDIGGASKFRGSNAMSDIFIAFSSEQVKDTRNENPTEDPDIRYSITPEDDAMEWLASQYELDDVPLEDPKAEEGRVRMAKSKQDFIMSRNALWNERWLTEGKVLDAKSVRKNIKELVTGAMMNSDTSRKYKTELVDKTLVDAKSAFWLMKEGKHSEAADLLWDSAVKMIENVDFIDDENFKNYKDLRDYMRTTSFRLGEEYWSDVDFSAFRKRNFGKIKLVKGETNIDEIYQELQERWPEWFDEDEQMTAPDQLLHIEEVLDAIQPYKVAYSSEEAEQLAGDIASDLYDIVYEGEEYKSIADTYKERYDAKTKALKERHQEALRKVREEGDLKVRKEKAKFKEYKEQKKNAKEKAKHFGRIAANIDWLTDRLLNETKDKNIPEGFRKSLAHMLMQFDMQTERSKKLEEKYGAAKKTFQMRELQKRLEQIAKEDDTGEFRYDGYLFYLMDALAEKVDGKPIDSLDTEDLIVIDTMLRSIKHNFSNYNKVRLEEEKVAIANIGDSTIAAMEERIKKYGKRKNRTGTLGLFDKLVNEGEQTPIYLFERLDPTGQGIGAMYKELRRGEDQHIRNMNFLRNRFQSMFQEYFNKSKPGSELESWRDDSQAQTFNLENGAITLNPAQIMSLYCLSKRTQAMGHILGSGIVASPINVGQKLHDQFKGKDEQVNSVRITYSEIQDIITKLTPEQMKLADEMQSLLNNEMAAWGNETSLEMHGIKLFREKDYFPIKSSGESLAKTADSFDVQEKIKNFGFTKPLVRNANNAIMIDDIFSVVADHCNKMSLYNSMAIPISDFMRVYNYKQRREDGTVKTSVQAMIGDAFTRKVNDYIMKFIGDVNGNTKTRSDAVNDLMNKALANYKKASIGANFRVALQQPTAIFRSLMAIDAKYFVGIKPISPADVKEMFAHCPIALWKSWGHYDMDMGRDIEDIMMNNDWSRWDTVTMGAYGALDNWTWSLIWQAVKKEVKANNPNVKVGSDEFFRLCNERASEVFDKTQVVDSIFHRSDTMRSKNTLTKMATSFMAEPTLTFNVFRDSLIKANEMWKDGDKAGSVMMFNKMAFVLALNAAAVSASAAIWDAVRGKGGGDDDDDEGFAELWLANFKQNFLDNAPWAQWNNIYFVKDIISLKDGWGTSNMALEGFETIFKGMDQLKKKITEGSNKSWYDIFMNLFGGFGYVTGVPVKTIMRDVKAVFEKFGIDVFAADGTEEDESLMDTIANKMGYRPVQGKGDGEAKVKDSFFARLGIGKTEEEKEQEAFDKKATEIAGKTADLTGEAKDKKVWSYVTTYMKSQNGDKPLADVIQEGDYKKVQEYRDMYVAAGGDTDYFDERIFATSKSAMKKTIVYDPTDAQIEAQENIKDYLLNHGMADYELSEMAYKSNTAKDMKIAFMINDKDAMLETLEPLVRAGLSYEDLERIWENRNRIDVMKYKSSKGRYADRLKSTGKFIWPTNGSITSYFGYRNAPTRGASSNHPAIDIGAPMGAEVVASDGGVVISTGWNGGYGNSVGIKHDNGMVTYYNHLSAWNVKVGDTVAQGQPIANVGSTGVSTGPHLDFKVLDANGKPVDPLKYLASRS